MSNIVLPYGGNGFKTRDVVALTRQEIKILIGFHDVAQRHDWAIVCTRCQRHIQGANTGTERILAVTCHCTEYRCDLGPGAGREPGEPAPVL